MVKGYVLGIGARDIQRAFIDAGYTRQWRYKRDLRHSRIWLAEERGLRWCIRCGRDLHFGMPIDAIYCSGSCRSTACRMRRARGCVPGDLKKARVLVGDALDVSALRSLRSEMFYRCHGRFIEDAAEVCPRWEWESR